MLLARARPHGFAQRSVQRLAGLPDAVVRQQAREDVRVEGNHRTEYFNTARRQTADDWMRMRARRPAA